MRVCQTCNGPLPPPSPHPCRPRKFCSERCRKRQYDLECTICGGRVDGTTPSRTPAEPVCIGCRDEHYVVWTREAITLAMQEWADEHGGVPPSAEQWRRGHVLDPDALPSVNRVTSRFGTWNAAVRAAGFEPHAIGPVGGYTRLTDEQRREAVRRYKRGESTVRIAADFGCSAQAIQKTLGRAGVERRPSFGRAA